MIRLLSIPALLLIAVNVAVHIVDGRVAVPGREPAFILMGWQHYAQMAVLLLLLLMARTVRDRLYPALTALAVLTAGYALTRFDHFEFFFMEAVYSLTLPVLWCLTALCAASAAASAFPPPEERPGLTGFKKAVFLLVVVNCGLAALATGFGRPVNSFFYGSLAAMPLFIVFPVWLLIAAGRWAYLSFIAGLAAVVPPLSLGLALGANFPVPPEQLILFHSQGLGFQLTLLCLLAGLICLISLAVKAGVRLTSRARRPVRPLARALALFPAAALVMAALLLAARPLTRLDIQAAPFQGETRPLRLAGLEVMIPQNFSLGPVSCRLPLEGRENLITLSEIKWNSEEEANETLAVIDRKLRNPEPLSLAAELSGNRSREFGRPAWLIVTSTYREPEGGPVRPVPAHRLNAELYLYCQGGGVRLSADFDYDPRTDAGRDYELFRQRSVDLFMAAARELSENYRWVGPAGRVGGAAFRTAYGSIDPPLPGLRLKAAVYQNASGSDRPPSSRETFFIRWGEQTGLGAPDGPPSLDRLLAFYNGVVIPPRRPRSLAGLDGFQETLYFRRAPVSLSPNRSGSLSVIWRSSDRTQPPLEIKFTAPAEDRDPKVRAGLLAEALGQWEAVAGTLRLSGGPAAESGSE